METLNKPSWLFAFSCTVRLQRQTRRLSARRFERCEALIRRTGSGSGHGQGPLHLCVGWSQLERGPQHRYCPGYSGHHTQELRRRGKQHRYLPSGTTYEDLRSPHSRQEEHHLSYQQKGSRARRESRVSGCSELLHRTQQSPSVHLLPLTVH